MRAIPVFCDNCGTIFESPLVLAPSATVHLWNNKVGPCPACGGWGSTPDGRIEAVGDAIRLISGSARTIVQFQQLERILQEAKQQSLPAEKMAQRIEAEAPALSEFAQYILHYLVPKNAGEFWGITSAILAAIPLLMTLFQTQNQEFDDKQVAAIVEKAVASALEQTESKKQQAQIKSKTKKIGRNETCPCGSGKKYKRCCLDRANGSPTN